MAMIPKNRAAMASLKKAPVVERPQPIMAEKPKSLVDKKRLAMKNRTYG